MLFGYGASLLICLNFYNSAHIMTQANKEEQVCCKEGNNAAKVKILAVHGYRQNGEVFRQKTGSFRKMLHKWAQFTYITAPHKVIPVDDLNKTSDEDIVVCPDVDQYGWFFNRDDKTYRGIRKGGPAIGFEESLSLIEDVFKNEGPFDGLLGFSQGACFVGLLCDLQQRGLLKYRFKFAIFSSGFKSNSLPHAKYYGDILTIPSMHIYGKNDSCIPTEMSMALRDEFEEPHIVEHDGGHYLPASSQQKHKYQKFIKLMLLHKQQLLQKNDTPVNNKIPV